jgi:APA family basic amino acid/polyamine antiporter
MDAELRRFLGVGGASVIGVGAMLGTGVFAAWTPAVDLAESGLLTALLIAAAVAALNATSTASLARTLPQSGGVYAYGRAYLSRSASVIAGYAFVLGKAASAGAAALTIGAYAWPGQERLVGLVAVSAALALDLRGIVKSMKVTAVLIAVVLTVLGTLVVTSAVSGPGIAVAAPGQASAWGVIAGSGILFVAFAGYARITVLGEEVRDPARTIPRAMIISFGVVIVVYTALGLAVLASVGAGLALTTAPLEAIADAAGGTGLAIAVRIAAVMAAGAVLLSLLAGIGRTLFAMGRGGDAPGGFTTVSSRSVPWRAEVAAAVLAAGVVAFGGIGFALAISAGLILTYYGIAHACVLARVRRGALPVALGVIAALGLLGCVVVVAGLMVAAAQG